MTTITDSFLMNVFYDSEKSGYAPRKYLLTYGYNDSNIINTKTFNAVNLKDAKLLASEYVLRFARGKLLTVSYVGANKW